jgi:hypothetical protein
MIGYRGYRGLLVALTVGQPFPSHDIPAGNHSRSLRVTSRCCKEINPIPESGNNPD